ncbi:hypothetical protein [Nakamurella leprariae]|uniref:DUF2567 domain-containing protein n=1 Tax=Nakamurella leprariae TaxID=2803911 RepID=A0A938YC37_9ACTN|nr:hypothetical protein [Nakamurella leprariae]MBM9466903.1 hypothetical protein [Nakamurella leprariae]
MTLTAVRRTVLLVGGGALLAGVLQAVLWWWLAPQQHLQVAANGAVGAVASAFRLAPFASVAIWVLLGLVLAAVVGVAAWQGRAARGPRILLVLLVGSLGGAVVAWGLAQLLAGTATDVGSAAIAAVHSGAAALIVQPPTLPPLWVGVLPAALAVGIYTFLAGWSGSAELGRSAPSGADEHPAERQHGGG